MTSRTKIEAPITTLHGVGTVLAKKLERLGIRTVADLLWHIPFRYEDFRTLSRIVDVKVGQTVTVAGTVEFIASRRSFRRRMSLTEALVRDDSGTIKVVWFNQPYLTKNIRPNDQVMLAGRVSNKFGGLQLVSPSYESLDKGDTLHVGRLVPVYSTTAGITSRQIRYFVSQVLDAAAALPDPLPNDLVAHERLMTIPETIRTIHFPPDEAARDAALERLKFDELLVFQLKRLLDERNAPVSTAPAIPFIERTVKEFVRSLPFTLTNAQRRAAWDMLQEMERPLPMNRLLEGDVGSGKTVVAAIVAANTLAAGFSVALMAPTEILARQHFLTLSRWLAKDNIPVGIRTSAFHEWFMQGEPASGTPAKRPRLTIGTHALLEHRVDLGTLGLVVVDEQHRFGVAQRQTLAAKTKRHAPHFLSMTATPIPRSLALTLARDLKLSVLRTLPKGRRPITTHFLRPTDRDRAYRTITTEIQAGRQAFVVAPLIEPSDPLRPPGREAGRSFSEASKLGVAAATTLFDELVERFRTNKLALLHGKLASAEKDRRLLDFANGKVQILVTTPVVEVGIDVPNATVMVIEGAERFGLAQLHQLRGRIGRGAHASTCFLIAQNVTPLAEKRLRAVASMTDGFALAELDLKLRGPGDLVGTMQSGFFDFQFATLGDHLLMERARKSADTILQKDQNLASFPLLHQAVQRTASEVPRHD
ncbi:MAG: ATP-dependent DNA helicase RecG [Candidatus Kerfeldbacteria bacterium]|nr:ATP-dependent DNA helicase RecG [Candidatus Kerfeldbacteria bacterium]